MMFKIIVAFSCWAQGGTAGKGEDLEDRDGENGPTCEHGENKDNGVGY